MCSFAACDGEAGERDSRPATERRPLMSFIDGYVVPVPNDKKAAYRDAATKMADYFKELGATRIVESWGTDLRDGKLTDFKMAVKAEKNENVVFSWVEWPSKQVRDVAMEKMRNDPRMQDMSKMPFD